MFTFGAFKLISWGLVKKKYQHWGRGRNGFLSEKLNKIPHCLTKHHTLENTGKNTGGNIKALRSHTIKRKVGASYLRYVKVEIQCFPRQGLGGAVPDTAHVLIGEVTVWG